MIWINRWLIVCLLLSVSGYSAAQVADLIVTNGKIFTGISETSYVQALAISGDRIIATGRNEQVKALASSATREIDLGGRTVIPGINDAHLHLHVHPAQQIDLPLEGMDPTWADLEKAMSLADRLPR